MAMCKYTIRRLVCRSFLQTLFTLCLLSVTAYAQSTIITTVAGTGVAGHTGDGGAATAARMNPVSVAVDTFGNLYIGDFDNRVVRRVSVSGVVTTVAGNGTTGYSGDGGPATDAQLYANLGIAVDNAGNLFIADKKNNAVRRVDVSGVITTIAGTGVAGYGGDGGPATAALLDEPTDVDIDDAGNIYISDLYNYIIRKIDPSGIITTYAGIPDSGGTTGNGGAATAAKLGLVYGIALDHSGNVYITDYYPKTQIRKISTTGLITLLAGSDTGAAIYFTLYDLAVDDTGNVLFAEGNLIHKVGTGGTVSTFAGNGLIAFSGDGGPPLLASLRSPHGLVFDKTGNLHVADPGHLRVRKIGKPPTGIATAEQKGLAIFPNPNNGTFQIKGINEVNGCSIDITDITGRVVYKQKYTTGMTIVLPNTLQGGIYFVHVTTTSTARVFTICIEH